MAKDKSKKVKGGNAICLTATKREKQYLPARKDRRGGEPVRIGYSKFKVGEACYLYDTTTNAIIGISAAAYAILEDYLRAGRRGVVRKFAGRMRAEGLDQAVNFLQACRGRRMLQPMRQLNYLAITSARNLRRQYDQGIKRMTLGITERCNQRCRYCPYGCAGRGAPRRDDMSWETVRQSIHYLLSHAAAATPVLDMFGGEPTLNWPVLQQAILYVRRDLRRPDVEIVLCTNGTLLDRPKLEFLMANKVVLQISLDGPARVHDKARVLSGGGPTHAAVLRKLRWIRSRKPAYYRKYVRPHCTFGHENDLLEIFGYFNQPMFQGLRISFGYRGGAFRVSKADRIRHEAQLDELIEQHIQSLRKRSPFQRAFFSNILYGALGPTMLRKVGRASRTPTPNSACIPGQVNMFVTGSGTLHPCEDFAREAAGQIGRCESGIDIRKAQRLMQPYARLCNRMCQGCWAWRLCSHCFLQSIGPEGRHSPSRKKRACQREKKRIAQNLRRYVHLWQNEPAWAAKVKGTLRYSMAHQLEGFVRD